MIFSKTRKNGKYALYTFFGSERLEMHCDDWRAALAYIQLHHEPLVNVEIYPEGSDNRTITNEISGEVIGRIIRRNIK